MNDIKICVGKSSFYDITDIVSTVKFSGKKKTAPRTVTISILDTEMYEKIRVKINCENGWLCIFYVNGKEVFRGLIIEDTYGNTRKLQFTAYDNMIYFTNNKDSFSYTKKTLSHIFRDCCSRLSLPVGSVAGTGYVIPELIKRATTYWDVVEDAMSQTYAATGIRYYISSEKGVISLRKRSEASNLVILDPQINTAKYSRTRSIYNTRTRLKLSTSEGTVKKEYVNGSLEAKIGMFQEVAQVDEDISAADLNQRVQIFKNERAIPERTYKINGAIGDISVISGKAVYVNNEHLGIKQVLYVDEDVHTFQNGSHTMDITLNFAKNIHAAG